MTDLHERVISYDLQNTTNLNNKRLVLNFKPIKHSEYVNKFCPETDKFGTKEFSELGVPIAKAITNRTIQSITIYQSKLIVSMHPLSSLEDAFYTHADFVRTYREISGLNNPSFNFNIYAVPKADMYNFMKYFRMMWTAFVSRTLGEIYEIASKKDKSLPHEDILDRVLSINPEALNKLSDGIRSGIIVDSKGNLFENND